MAYQNYLIVVEMLDDGNQFLSPFLDLFFPVLLDLFLFFQPNIGFFCVLDPSDSEALSRVVHHDGAVV
jgi:hypothetical protein